MTAQITSSFAMELPLPAVEVWDAMSNYGDLSWAQEGGIEDVELVDEGIGMVRKVRLAGLESRILERLVAMDADTMSMTYVIDEDGMPGLMDYVATARVLPRGSSCAIRWLINAKVKDEEAEAMQLGLDAMAEGLVTLFAAQFAPQQGD